MAETVYIDHGSADGPVALIYQEEPGQIVWTGTAAQVETRNERTAPLLDEVARLAGVAMLEEAPPLPFYAVPLPPGVRPGRPGRVVCLRGGI